MTWFISAVKKYAVFRGRSRRKEYWYFVLVAVLASGVLRLVDTALGLNFGDRSTYGALQSLWWLALLIPSLAVAVRRLHDTDRSGWWWLINLVPVIGFIVFVVFAAQAGTPGPNRYGADPKAGEA
jgi:uncharacterized membrane protein YhaH (DUF805 family)